jgi:putative mRNA 3-end processing factor
VQLIFHGAAQEVGRSCIELQTQGDRFLLDCGLKFHEAGFDYPAKVFEVRHVNGVFLSHAHLDHSGGLPFFEHYRMICPIFCTQETREITQILLKDSHKIARIKHLHEAFSNLELKQVYKSMKDVVCNKEEQFRGIKYNFLNAGHIPGSASIKVTAEGITVLYTGDYNTRRTQLMQEADPHTWGHVDVLITECTYGNRQLPSRDSLEEEFLDHVAAVLKRGGRVLIPVFAVGRAQEIAIMLGKRDWPVKIYMDGMAKKVTRAVLDGKSPYVINRDKLAHMFSNVEFVKSDDHRTKAAEGPGIFLTTSGMLQGGPAIRYLEHLWSDKNSAVLLTGYQVKNTNGWMLDQEQTCYLAGYRTKVQCEVKRYDFSGHLSSEDIKQTILAVQPRILILNHGNVEATAAIASWARDHLRCEIFTPEIGEQITISADGKPSSMKLYDECIGEECIYEHQHPEKHHEHKAIEHEYDD